MLDKETLALAADLAAEVRGATARRIGTFFSVDGEVAVYGRGALKERGDLPVVDYIGPALPHPLHDAVAILFEAVLQVKEKKTRSVPVTRGELRDCGVTRSQLSRLEKASLIRQRIVKLCKAGGKNQPAQSVVYFTDEGRGYVRRFFDEGYALPAEGGGDGGHAAGDKAV